MNIWNILKTYEYLYEVKKVQGSECYFRELF